MKISYVAIILMVAVLSGTLARPRRIRSHRQQRQHRETSCTNIIYRPFSPALVVCGSDGKTYVNEQHIEFENCIYNTAVTVERHGWCDEETQAVEQLKELIWQLVSMVFGEVFEDIDEETGEFLHGLLQALVTDDESGENKSDSGEELFNFLKTLVESDSNEASESLDNLWKFLESLDLDSSEEKTDQPASSENEIPNTEDNDIPINRRRRLLEPEV